MTKKKAKRVFKNTVAVLGIVLLLGAATYSDNGGAYWVSVGSGLLGLSGLYFGIG